MAASEPIYNINDVLNIRDYLKIKNEQHYVLFMTGIGTGYRPGDLVELRVRDIKKALRKGEFEFLENKKKNTNQIKEKNRRPRPATVRPGLATILKEYIKNKNDYEYMFPSREGRNQHITVGAVRKELKKAGRYFGLEHIGAHSMRKTYAVRIWLTNDRDIMIVKEALGHDSIEDTKRYLGINKRMVAECSRGLDDFYR